MSGSSSYYQGRPELMAIIPYLRPNHRVSFSTTQSLFIFLELENIFRTSKPQPFFFLLLLFFLFFSSLYTNNGFFFSKIGEETQRYPCW